MLLNEFENLLNKNSYIPIGKGKYPIKEILVVKMLKTTHPEHTISYRFEDNMAVKNFVFLTDHENTDELSNELRAHLRNADVLAMDGQYDRVTYKKFTAGFGHGTPDYIAKAAIETNAKKVYIVHHDPDSDDEKVDSIVADCNKALEGTQIVAIGAKDYLEIEI